MPQSPLSPPIYFPLNMIALDVSSQRARTDFLKRPCVLRRTRRGVVGQVKETMARMRRRPLEDRVSFLTHRINARLQQVCNPVIFPHKLDLYSSRIIVALAEKGPMRVGELVDLMALPQSTMSHQLKRLEKDGYVLRTRSESDNRTVVITLTERGTEVAETCNRLSDCVMNSISEELSEAELEH